MMISRMYTALKFARAAREQRTEKTRQLEKEKLERKLNKLKAKLAREIRAHEEQLRRVQEISVPIPESAEHDVIPCTSTSSSATAVNLAPARINYDKHNQEDSEDDEDEFAHVYLASASPSAPGPGPLHSAATVQNLHFLSVSPVAGGSDSSSCSNLSQVNMTSPVFCARSITASMQGHDRTRGSLTYSDCSAGLDINGKWKGNGNGNGNELNTISGTIVNENDAASNTQLLDSAKKKNSLYNLLTANIKPNLNASQTRLTANMIGTFIVLAGLLAAILGFLANEDYNHVSPAVMAIGFFMVLIGFVIIFLGEIAILLYSNVLTKFLVLIGNNKNGVIAPKLDTFDRVTGESGGGTGSGSGSTDLEKGEPETERDDGLKSPELETRSTASTTTYTIKSYANKRYN